MAYSASQLVGMGYGGYQGWGDPEANADFNATGGSGKKTNSGGSSSTPTAALDPQQALSGALDASKQIRQFNIDSAQPQISTLQSSKTSLDDQYQKLLDSIKGDQTLATNKATLNANNELGRRGITGGGAYDSAISQAGVQAAQPFESLKAQTGIQQAQDENSIASQIAALQSGNPAGATSSALGISGIAANLGQLGVQQQAANFAQKYLNIPGVGIYDTTSGKIISPYGTTGGSNGYNILGTY